MRLGFDILHAPPLDTDGGVPARLQADMVPRQLLALPAQQRAVLAGRYDGYRDTDLAQARPLSASFGEPCRAPVTHFATSLGETGAFLPPGSCIS